MADAKQQLLAQLEELAELTTLDEGSPQSFRARAYEIAVTELSLFDGDVASMTEAELTTIDGVGKSMAAKIRQFFDHGVVSKLVELREKYPADYVALSKIPGLGPKKLAKLRDALGVHDAATLSAALAAKRVRELPGFGAKTEEKLAQALERMGSTGKERRTPIALALPLAEDLRARLAALPGAQSVRYCGSLRRFRDTIGDLDFTVASSEAAPIMEAFRSFPMVREIVGSGETKTSVLTDTGLQVDLRVVAPSQFGAAILYFTGSKQHNIQLRQRAIARGLTLNEYALSDVESGAIIASATEHEIYSALELAWVPPPMREGSGELEAAANASLPEAVTTDTLLGDGRWIPTTKSAHAALVEAAASRGLQWAIGSREERGPRDFHSFEAAVLSANPDGSFPAATSAADISIAVPTTVGEDCTQVLLQIIRDPRVDVLAHLTGRWIGAASASERQFDIDVVLRAAVEHEVALEITGDLERLDPPPAILRRAAELGCTFLLASEAAEPEALRRLDWAVLQAQRGWISAPAVLNTRTVDQFRDWLDRRR